MEFKDYYEILGIEPEADAKAVKTAYRRLARKYHPDVSTEREAEKHFKEVAEAYEVLSDDTKRAEYDQLRRSGGGRSFEPPPGWQSRSDGSSQFAGEGDFSEFFESIFGAGRFRQGRGGQFYSDDFTSSRGRDIEVELALFLEDTISGESRTIEYNLPHYSESGRLDDIRKTLKVKIPAGVGDGERIRLKGQGAPGFGNGPAGDLYLKIRLVPHPLFDVVGQDINITVPLAPWEAALGARITVPTLSGKITLSIAPDSQSGQRLRVKGHGLKTRTGRGDLFAILKIVMPQKASESDKALWQTLSKKAAFNPRREWEQ